MPFSYSRRAIWAFSVLLLCSSCLGLTATKEQAAGPITDTWELMYQIDEQGAQEKPPQSIRTLIEFTKNGQAVFKRIDKETSNVVKTQSGTYKVDGDRVIITDSEGPTVNWPYRITDDILVLTMPELRKKFYWRRAK
jgi:hypothetical protein